MFGSRAREARRAVPIHAYVGPNGGGKTLAMVYDTLPSLDAGRPVLSTVHLLDPEEGGPHPMWRVLDRLVYVLDAEHCDVLADEVTGVASSRSSMSMPVQLQNVLVQLRRRDVVLRWTAPNWSRADVIMREVTKAVTLCNGSFTKRDPDSAWPTSRLFKWATYDAQAFDEFSLGKAEDLRTVVKQYYWRPGKRAERAYDSKAEVEMIDYVSEAGTCLTCGGTRSRPKCRCERDDAAAERPGGRGADVSAAHVGIGRDEDDTTRPGHDARSASSPLA